MVKKDFIDEYWDKETENHKQEGRKCLDYPKLNYMIKIMKEDLGKEIIELVNQERCQVLGEKEIWKVAAEPIAKFFEEIDAGLGDVVIQVAKECQDIREFSVGMFKKAEQAKNLKEFEELFISEFEETHQLMDYANANLVAVRHLLKKAEAELSQTNM